MRFYKQVWGIIWEFNSIADFIAFSIGRLLAVVVFIALVYFLSTCESLKPEETPDGGYKPIPAEFYEYKYK